MDWKNYELVRWSSNCKNQCFGTIATTSTTTNLLVKKLVEDAIPPVRATLGSIGYDIHTTDTITIPPKTRTLVGTGIAIATLEETYGRIAPRSRLTIKHSVDIAAVVDMDY